MAPNDESPVKRIGIVGAGSMGSMMALGIAELGFDISIWDISPDNVKEALSRKPEGGKDGKNGKIDGYTDIAEFVDSLSSEEVKVLIFSITHGNAADEVIAKMGNHLGKGFIVLDGGNEHYRNTERRQHELSEKGVAWIGMGVSGGYQSARRGPSMSPGGDKAAVQKVLPILEKFAAKASSPEDTKQSPCVAYIGPGGSGHYVKMMHNGIENGMLSTLCEAWGIMKYCLGMSNGEIGKVLDRWNSQGSLRSTFLVQIGAEICQRKKSPKGDGEGEGRGEGGYVLDDVLDKVVQDDDSSEGTGFWSVMEAAYRRVTAPTIAAGQFLRYASGERAERLEVAKELQTPPPKQAEEGQDKEAFIEELRKAVYASFVCSFCQGLELISKASRAEEWNVDLATCIRIWREGCIIQSSQIADMLEAALAAKQGKETSDIKLLKPVAQALQENYPALKKVVLKGTEWDAMIPSLSASLEYLKYDGSTALPTQFMEAEMDFFGAHAYDRPHVKGEDPGKAKKGAHHYEWRPA
ncbi:6-phosphogluconate dehydrogenase (decarboxylating) [Cladophialophora carrionii CBS 160.54]|uniref:6-phosphogluconate dehydrogenase, decarboxylating n=1 Tax=Cladophialophora carrionii CBS 160.54 TaxID=1279043 RepID=V9D844_9EURO|nr:6-phosphogluconate dehydrogenase (decarboxylating) [Cladophialophora carrionii CBS 160.54]ETI22152.1 6-phosphogluconate dehydrogenase (decarboxylating) [Cladophialophora carrionii CBS 160.54]